MVYGIISQIDFIQNFRKYLRYCFEKEMKIMSQIYRAFHFILTSETLLE